MKGYLSLYKMAETPFHIQRVDVKINLMNLIDIMNLSDIMHEWETIKLKS